MAELLSVEDQAQQLFNSMYNAGSTVTRYSAKKSAIIAVKKIIETIKFVCDNEFSTIHIIYWEKVMEKIQKL